MLRVPKGANTATMGVGEPSAGLSQPSSVEIHPSSVQTPHVNETAALNQEPRQLQEAEALGVEGDMAGEGSWGNATAVEAVLDRFLGPSKCLGLGSKQAMIMGTTERGRCCVSPAPCASDLTI